MAMMRATLASKLTGAVQQAVDAGTIDRPFDKVTMADIAKVPHKQWTALKGVGTVTADRLIDHANAYGAYAQA
jgi:hypothetical protein